MKKFWLVMAGLVLVLSLAVVGLAGCSPGGTVRVDTSALRLGAGSQQEGIWVSGEGKVKVVPDVALLSLGIEVQEKSVAEAQAKAAGAMDSVMEALRDAGIAERDIQTTRFSIQQVTRWDADREEEIVVGYRVTNSVNAKIRDLDRAGSIIDAVAIAGGDLTRISGISFSVEDPTDLYREARIRAIEDARARAKTLAETAGIKLGKPTYIAETSYVPGPVYRDALKAAEGAAVTPISPGEMELTVTVQVVYDID
ncbi:MAG: SIMPL domain-containing protein [Dehalococcoidales bacterium]|nr:SIMPL domain-containing protein [Dehalococcoidales bacterium]